LPSSSSSSVSLSSSDNTDSSSHPMEEIIHAFGIDVRLIVIQMFNFALLMGALWYFLYTPVLKLLNDREATVRKGVEDAEKAAQALRDADTEKGAVLSEARKSAETIVADAKTHALSRGTDIVHEAEAKAARVLEDAKARAEEERIRAHKASEAEIAQAAILAAEKILATKQ
jgi:F-type H+-transporting ATPase subunit b